MMAQGASAETTSRSDLVRSMAEASRRVSNPRTTAYPKPGCALDP